MPSPTDEKVEYLGPAIRCPSYGGYGIHRFYLLISMVYRHSQVISGGHRGELIPAGSHRLGSGRLVVAVPATQSGDDPRQPRQRARQVRVSLPRRVAFQARADRRRGFEDLRVGNVTAWPAAAVAGINQLDGAHRGPQRQRAHLEQALGIV